MSFILMITTHIFYLINTLYNKGYKFINRKNFNIFEHVRLYQPSQIKSFTKKSTILVIS